MKGLAVHVCLGGYGEGQIQGTKETCWSFQDAVKSGLLAATCMKLALAMMREKVLTNKVVSTKPPHNCWVHRPRKGKKKEPPKGSRN